MFHKRFPVPQNTVTEGRGTNKDKKKKKNQGTCQEKMNGTHKGFLCPYGATVITHCGDVVVIPRAKTTIKDEQKSMMPSSQFLTVAPGILTITAGDRGVDCIPLLDQGCSVCLTKLFHFQ